MDKVEKYNKILEAATERNKGIETYINLPQLEQLTEELDENYVIDSNEELTTKHQLVLSAYGFEDMLGMYNYALSNTSKEEFLMKGKNYDVLDKVKRTVTRGGSKIQTTVYADIKDTDNKIKVGGKRQEPQKEKNKEHGIQLIPVVLDGIESQIPTEDLQHLNKLTQGMEVVLDSDRDRNYIELLVDESYSPRACLGFHVGDKIELTYIATDETVDKLTLTAIHKLIELSIELEKDIQMGVIEGDHNIQLLIAEQYNIEFDEEKQMYHSTYGDLVQSFGEDYIKLKEKK